MCKYLNIYIYNLYIYYIHTVIQYLKKAYKSCLEGCPPSRSWSSLFSTQPRVQLTGFTSMSFPSWSLSTKSFQASPQISLMQSNLWVENAGDLLGPNPLWKGLNWGGGVKQLGYHPKTTTIFPTSMSDGEVSWNNVQLGPTRYENCL